MGSYSKIGPRAKRSSSARHSTDPAEAHPRSNIAPLPNEMLMWLWPALSDPMILNPW